jgi:anti-anti-sigma factor
MVVAALLQPQVVVRTDASEHRQLLTPQPRNAPATDVREADVFGAHQFTPCPQVLAQRSARPHAATIPPRLVESTRLSIAQKVSSAIGSAMGQEARGLVVDLCEITYLDSAGVALLLRLAERLRARRRQLYLVVPRGSPVRRVLEVTGLPRVIPLEARLEDALARCDRGLPDDPADRTTSSAAGPGRVQPVGRANRLMARKWAATPAMTSRWKTSW